MIFRLPLILKILGSMCIAIVCFTGCDVMNFAINFIFLIEPFFYITKKRSERFPTEVKSAHQQIGVLTDAYFIQFDNLKIQYLLHTRPPYKF